MTVCVIRNYLFVYQSIGNIVGKTPKSLFKMADSKLKRYKFVFTEQLKIEIGHTILQRIVCIIRMFGCLKFSTDG